MKKVKTMVSKIYTAKDKNHFLVKALLLKGTDNFELFWTPHFNNPTRGWILNGVFIGWNSQQALEKINNLPDLRKFNKVPTDSDNFDNRGKE